MKFYKLMILSLMSACSVYGAADVEFNPKKLRGYGKVSALEKQIGAVKVLEINCESPEKALLVKSKFLSDLKQTGKSPYIEKIAAFVKGNKAYILTAANKTQIEAYAKQHNLSTGKTIEVPMYLDSWDKYGFRFYYRPWAIPKGSKNYDPSKEFEFADKLGALGFVYWAKVESMDYTYGLTNSRWWDWAERAASRRKLPIVINTAMSDTPWLKNLYREQTAMKMPQYCGSFHSVASPYLGGTGFNSWASTTAKDVELSVLQRIVKKYSKLPNTIEFLEPHGEPYHGKYSWFLEYGPVVDKSFRTYLKNKYGSIQNVASRWGMDNLKSWDNVHLPELASFTGWGENALDLTGEWKVNYMKLKKKISNFKAYRRKIIPVEPAPEAWYSASLDDSKWSTITAPGHDEQMFLEQRPAVMRRSFNVKKDYLKKHKKLWLYLWDLNFGYKDTVKVVINGKTAGTDQIPFNTPHWAAFEVEKQLKSGKNLLAIRLPKGYIGYRTYISPEPPKMYPMLGEHKNAQWVDFVAWRMNTTTKSIERGISMIRQVDKNRSIICMAPDSYAANIRELCVKYGAHFRNTGYMGGVWAEYLPMLMRGANLPFSVEPGGPAKELPGFKRMMGLYMTSGVNAINYFIHVGNIMWNKSIREYFEKNQAMFKMFGKMHQQKSKVAILYNSLGERLLDYPWKSDYNNVMPMGYWNWRINTVLYQHYKVDGLMPGDFTNGLAKPYKIIIDANNMLMSEKEVKNIENWVKNGGIFVAFVQTGRHSYEKADSWPIAKLTGYKVIGKHQYHGEKPEKSKLSYASGQKIFDNQFLRNLGSQNANGIMLKKTSNSCQDLLKWEDGSTAVGMRKLGKGYVFNVGAKFADTTVRWQEGRTRKLLSAILKKFKIKANTAYADKVKLSHYVTNNGLKDVWVIFNEHRSKKLDTELKFRDGKKRKLINIVTQKELSPKLSLGPSESVMLVSDRQEYMSTGLEWFELQRGWWSGTQTTPDFNPPADIELPALNLNKQWKIKALASSEKVDRYVKSGINDSSWKQIDLKVWKYPTEVKSKKLVLRKLFKVPMTKTGDKLFLSISGWYESSTMACKSKLKVWLNGKLISGDLRPNHGLVNYPLTAKAGTTYLLAIEITGAEDSPWLGLRGNSFVWILPKADKTISLNGTWTGSKDVLTAGTQVKIPGRHNSKIFKRTVKIPANVAGKKVFIYFKGGPHLTGCIINGNYVRRHHHCVGDITYLNITPWLKPGKENAIELVRWNGDRNTVVNEVKLMIYNR